MSCLEYEFKCLGYNDNALFRLCRLGECQPER